MFHALLIPSPAQGHGIPMMQVAQCLANNYVKVTFVNTEFNHKLVMNAWSEDYGFNDLIHMVSIPDGMEPCDDRSNLGKLTEAMYRIMSGKLEELIEDINSTSEEKITCIVADGCLGWAIRVGKKMGIRQAVFWPIAAAAFALILSNQNLIDDGIINNNGAPMKNQKFQLIPTMPPVQAANLPWCIGNSDCTRRLFQFLVLDVSKEAKMADYVICNSTMELEPGAFTLFPKMLPIGPLLATNQLKRQAGHFWKEDLTCLTWLDQQPARSVIYVAFGSFTIFDPTQFEELAIGLELTNKPFLWVVRPGMNESTNDAYLNGFRARVGARGKIVSWAPQQKVLNHPSVACFISHCGWNSTLEGVSNGIPFLCWPYFADQFLNTTYICGIWKNGLGLNKDETGTITREEIKNKVEQLLSNKPFIERALNLQEIARTNVTEGRSSKNLSNFIDWTKGKKCEV